MNVRVSWKVRNYCPFIIGVPFSGKGTLCVVFSLLAAEGEETNTQWPQIQTSQWLLSTAYQLTSPCASWMATGSVRWSYLLLISILGCRSKHSLCFSFLLLFLLLPSSHPAIGRFEKKMTQLMGTYIYFPAATRFFKCVIFKVNLNVTDSTEHRDPAALNQSAYPAKYLHK
jgi:hypothetical protein